MPCYDTLSSNTLISPFIAAPKDHDNAWGIAEEAATNYGADRAKKTKGVPGPTPQQNRWFNFTKLYRLILRNRDKFRIAIYACVSPFRLPLSPSSFLLPLLCISSRPGRVEGEE